VCRYERGNAEFFRCPYHGWTYSDRGPLIGVPFPTRYGEDFDKEKLGLVAVPRLDTYRGFIFVSLAEEGPSLIEHLGRSAEYIDKFMQASPTDKVQLSAGVSKSNFHGNWKFVGMDGYHVNFTHKTVQDLQVRKNGNAESRKNNTDSSPNLTVDLGGGHCRDVVRHVASGSMSTYIIDPMNDICVEFCTNARPVPDRRRQPRPPAARR
jgi:phenylpropionate dioxygenase-like ring-hydroxylating dioxygenase large terminal subunit